MDVAGEVTIKCYRFVVRAISQKRKEMTELCMALNWLVSLI